MKKSILTMALLVAGLTSAMAVDYTATASIKMGTATTLKLREAATFSDATTDTGYDAKTLNVGGLVVTASGERFTQWATNNLEGVVLEFTPTAAAVSFAFSGVKGDLYLIDAKDNSRNKIVDGQTYDFTVEATEVGVANAARFTISKIGEQNLCFVNNVLQLTLYKGETVEIYQGDAAAATMTVNITTDVQDINLSDKTAGRYRVKLVNANKEYLIDVHPEKKAAEYNYQIIP